MQKWVIIKVFVLIVFTVSSLRRRKRTGWFCCLRGGRGRRGKSGGRRGRHTRCHFTEIYGNFCLTLSFFNFSKTVSIWCQSFFHHLLWFQCLCHGRVHDVQEAKSRLKWSEPFWQIAWCQFVFWHCFLYLVFLIFWLEALMSIKSSSINSSGVLLIVQYLQRVHVLEIFALHLFFFFFFFFLLYPQSLS